ncbi:MAG: SAM-dependent methyltransferase, partial [Rikenellaceae bacterium]|nr:SAM-dependent methyltransferase [Rikenellaceae bacterium]
MTFMPEDLDILTSPATRRLIEAHLGEDPVRLALTLKGDRRQAALVASQVKYLDRTRTKLPSYYAARCIVPPLAYEQSSGEAAAATKDYSGSLAVDLTCGLGVDAFYLSKQFRRVIAVERDPVLAAVARYNFSLLGAENISVKNTAAEDFLKNYAGECPDLIYVDPSRRDANARKVFLIGDGSPNVLELMPALLSLAPRVVVKNSPLFDIAAAGQLFPKHLSRIETVSVGGECKELLTEFFVTAPQEVPIDITVAGTGRWRFSAGDISGKPAVTDTTLSPETFPYLLILDVAFYKARMVKTYFDRCQPAIEAWVPAPGSFCFSKKIPDDFPGKPFRIIRCEEYRPKKLARELKARGIRRITVLKK